MPAVTVTRAQPELWSVTFGNPPANLADPEMILELQALVDQLEHDPAVTVRGRKPSTGHTKTYMTPTRSHAAEVALVPAVARGDYRPEIGRPRVQRAARELP
jgi:enoyl-CoA hydratase/carnithine racemase